MNAVYNLFLRNWINCRATEEQIDLAVAKSLITAEEAIRIKETKQCKLNNEDE
ncbi:hypothetical protein [Lysinibacillus sp. JNUCC 51]|uniref:hypothetical protein n=1 Tax=Lysinibacillus sp. JNUCC-51 TaxID=2792479 RepID=UPI0019381AA8|nr:hypothetical protein JNUCC51_00310 [Lysinibacillus sp. JNUCC-51]